MCAGTVPSTVELSLLGYDDVANTTLPVLPPITASRVVTDDTIPVRKSRVSTYLKDFPPSFATCHFVVFFQRWLALRHFTSCNEGRVLNVNYDGQAFLSGE